MQSPQALWINISSCVLEICGVIHIFVIVYEAVFDTVNTQYNKQSHDVQKLGREKDAMMR